MNALNRIQHRALLLVEFAGNRADGRGPFCVLCHNYQSTGHSADCDVGRAITEYVEVEKALRILKPEGSRRG